MKHNYTFLIASMLSLILFTSSCSKSDDTDNSPPTVIIVSPQNSSIVTDSTVIKIEAFDCTSSESFGHIRHFAKL